MAPTFAPFGPLPLAVVKELVAEAKLLEGDTGANCLAAKYVAAILNEMSKQDKSRVVAAWVDSGLSWAEFLPSTVEVDQFVADNSMEWTLAPAAAGMSVLASADHTTAEAQNEVTFGDFR